VKCLGKKVRKVGGGAKILLFWERWNAALGGGFAKGLLVLYIVTIKNDNLLFLIEGEKDIKCRFTI